MCFFFMILEVLRALDSTLSLRTLLLLLKHVLLLHDSRGSPCIRFNIVFENIVVVVRLWFPFFVVVRFALALKLQ
ncbi:hypothetical protein JHK82_042856 [Glycine max]|uniref:Uncharacterized protein n=1 Tax=Glycine max TaxID=3847 RepID=A0A0R0G393_SOYBN|nr:hypothetical protein JHK86_042873 [Glycine max]KAG4957118.1 hypothetical protein JHK85_043498 [Glycine max]KAG5105886.1 hypothetical protein JHK82_042856 [Glycine max]KAH1209765.1 hypothetical protein GmHk_15G044199 [Glycine max]KRH12732.1 hypothetical protein GLYMA_15G190600v4 [Glycine max]